MSSSESSRVVLIALSIGFGLAILMACVLLTDGYLRERGAQFDDGPSFPASAAQ